MFSDVCHLCNHETQVVLVKYNVYLMHLIVKCDHIVVHIISDYNKYQID